MTIVRVCDFVQLNDRDRAIREAIDTISSACILPDAAAQARERAVSPGRVHPGRLGEGVELRGMASPSAPVAFHRNPLQATVDPEAPLPGQVSHHNLHQSCRLSTIP